MNKISRCTEGTTNLCALLRRALNDPDLMREALIYRMAEEAKAEIREMCDQARAEIDEMLGFAPPF